MIKKDVSTKDIRKFCEESGSVICGVVIKLLKRSPVLRKKAGFSTVFNPGVFVTLDKLLLQKQLKGLLVSLMDHKILTSSQCDNVVAEFNNFYDKTLLCLGLFLKILMKKLFVWIISGWKKVRYPTLRHSFLW